MVRAERWLECCGVERQDGEMTGSIVIIRATNDDLPAMGSVLVET